MTEFSEKLQRSLQASQNRKWLITWGIIGFVNIFIGTFVITVDLRVALGAVSVTIGIIFLKLTFMRLIELLKSEKD